MNGSSRTGNSATPEGRNPVLFLSDVHYGAFDGEEEQRLHEDLVSLIDNCTESSTAICILGDLFDWWMEYPSRHPDLGAGLIGRFRSHIEQTGPILFITGNHDNWTCGYLHSIGFDVEHEYRRLQIDGKSALLLHGDGLSDPDFGLPRPPFHRLLRHRRFVRLYQILFSPETGWRLMRLFSDWNRRRSGPNPDRINRWAGEWLGKSDDDFVICGHDHVARKVAFAGGTLYNCGSFATDRTLLRHTTNGFELVVWDGKRRQMTPYDPNQPEMR